MGVTAFLSNYFRYDEGRLVSATIYGQDHHIRYKRKHVLVTVFNDGKKASLYKYVYGAYKRIDRADHYLLENGKKEFWGANHFTYDSAGRLGSESYIVLNKRSMHPGYEHNCTYQYDASGKLIGELRGYREAEYFYEGDELRYALVHEHEFGKSEYNYSYSIYVE